MMVLLSLSLGIAAALLLMMGWRWHVLQRRQRMIAILVHQINTLLTTARWNSELAAGRERSIVRIPRSELIDRVYFSLAQAMTLLEKLKCLATTNGKGSCTPPRTIDVRAAIEQEMHPAPPPLRT